MSDADPFSAEPAPQRKGWFGRNWFWVVPVGCLTPVVVCGGGLFALVAVFMNVRKDSTPYQEALIEAEKNAEVRAALGGPIETGFFVNGRMYGSNGDGLMHFNYPISGPDGSGTVYVMAESTAGGPWVYEEMRVRIDGGPEIDLRPGLPEEKIAAEVVEWAADDPAESSLEMEVPPSEGADE